MGYQTIDVPQGAFIGWGSKPGQIVEGTVTDYDPTGATDFNKKECPALEIELTRKAHSYSQKHSSWTSYEAGETVQLTCGLVQLKKKVRKAQPRIGDRIKIELVELIAVDSGTVKSFEVGIDRSAAKSNSSSGQQSAGAPPESPWDHGSPPADDPWGSAPSSSAPPDDEPPF